MTSNRQEEMNTKQAYEMLMQDLNAQLDQVKSNVEIESESKAKKLRAKSNSQSWRGRHDDHS